MATEGWLLCDGRVLASVEVARTGRERRMGLLGRDGIEGALLLERCRWVHTVRMRFALDVAYLDHAGVVMKTVRMAPHRVGIPVLRGPAGDRGRGRRLRPVGSPRRRHVGGPTTVSGR